VRPSVPRARLHQLWPRCPCTIGLEACSGAHHWARLFAQHGHSCAAIAGSFLRTGVRVARQIPCRNGPLTPTLLAEC
jgi:transposase